MRKFLTKIFWIILCILLFLVAELNVDSIYRTEQAINFEGFNANFISLLFSEPLTLIVALILESIGWLSATSLQFSLYLMIVLLAIRILNDKIFLFPFMLLYPPINLLAFNIQPMMISLLLGYCIFSRSENNFPASTAYRKDLITWLFCVGFHWVSIIFLPLILLKNRKYSFLVPITFIISYVVVNAYIVEGLSFKIDSYKSADANPASILHVQLTVMLAVLMFILSLAFRLGNSNIRFSSFLNLFFIVSIITITVMAGYKAGSRFAFVLDLFLILDLARYWLPKRVRNGVASFNG